MGGVFPSKAAATSGGFTDHDRVVWPREVYAQDAAAYNARKAALARWLEKKANETSDEHR